MAEIPTGYEDLQAWSQQQNDLLSQQQQLQQNLVNQQVQQSVDQLNYDKQKIDQNVQKQNQGLYTNYQKMANNYGVQAEQRAQMGLANSGYAETSRVNLFNAYQKNVTDTLNSANQLKADFDFQINQARQQGNITLAQNQLALYQQRMQLLTQEYDMKQQQRQFEYQQQRNQVADNQWQQSFDYQKSRDAVSDRQWQQSFDYQKQRDAVADSQWQKQYDLSKKAYTSSKRRSSSSRKSSGSSSGAVAKSGGSSSSGSSEEDLKRAYLNSVKGKTPNELAGNGSSSKSSGKPSQEDLAKNMKFIQGASAGSKTGANNKRSQTTNNSKVKDGYTGKIYNSPAELFRAYGY